MAKYKMKPCPFCGGEKLKIDSKKSANFKFINSERLDLHVVTVRCNKCHCKSPTVSIWLKHNEYNPIGKVEEQVMKVWNARKNGEDEIDE